MGKGAAKGKIANKVASKKNKKHLSNQNRNVLGKAEKAKIGSKTGDLPTGLFISQTKACNNEVN